MRGKIVYAYHASDGKLPTWFGRDPNFEALHQQWEATDRSGREPEKFHFVKGFHRGIELYGSEKLKGPEVAEKIRGLGLILVEGPNDVIRLHTLAWPAGSRGSHTISRRQ